MSVWPGGDCLFSVANINMKCLCFCARNNQPFLARSYLLFLARNYLLFLARNDRLFLYMVKNFRIIFTCDKIFQLPQLNYMIFCDCIFLLKIYLDFPFVRFQHLEVQHCLTICPLYRRYNQSFLARNNQSFLARNNQSFLARNSRSFLGRNN